MKKLFYFLLMAIVVPNIALAFTEHQSLGVALCNVFLPLGIYWWLMGYGRNIGKTIWAFFPVIFLAAFQIVLLYLYGRSIIGVDMFLNLVTTNTTEVEELLGNLLPAVVGVFVLYLPLLILGGIGIRKHWTFQPDFLLRQRRIGGCVLAAGLILSLGMRCCCSSFRFTNDVFPVNVGYNLWLAAERLYDVHYYDKTSKDFHYGSVSVHQDSLPEVYVLVIGETARSHNFQLYGYNRPTNPLLSSVQGLTVFSKAMSQSNTTHKSVPMLLSAATAENYDCIYHQKGVLTAFKEAGFHTAFFSNQRRNHSFIDLFGMEADDWQFIKDSVKNEKDVFDADLLPYVKKEIENRKHDKLFIVLHAYGSHFNYRERYPQSMAYFKPDQPTEAKAVNRRSLMNAYDNSIRYTDYFLSRLISMLNGSGIRSALLYTSDHGEDIFDDARQLFLHASPVPSLLQLQVPLLVWLSPQYRSAYPDIQRLLSANCQKPVETSVSVFHTMLKIGGVKTPFYKPSSSLADSSFTVAAYSYLTDRNTPISLKAMDIK